MRIQIYKFLGWWKAWLIDEEGQRVALLCEVDNWEEALERGCLVLNFLVDHFPGALGRAAEEQQIR